MRRLSRLLGLVLLAGLVALLAVDLRHAPSDAPPKIVAQVEGHGALLAGAAKAEIHVPYPVVPAGYGPKDRHYVTSAAQPQYARAIALQVGDAKLTLVSVDLLEIDSKLMDELRPRLPKDVGEVWVCATHTHTGMGNYDPNLLAQIAGTGRFKPEAREALIGAVLDAATAATRELAPADLARWDDDSVATTDRSHSDDAPDRHMTELSFKTPRQAIELLHLAAHPTTTPRNTAVLNADFPSLMTESPGFAHLGVTAALFQGSVGNASFQSIGLTGSHPPSVPVDVGELTVSNVILTLHTELHVGPSFTRRASSNLVDRLAAPREATLSVAKLGPLTFIAVPGEPTAAAGRALQQAVGDPNALIFGLCNGYVGYIETPDRVEKGIGEAPRQYYDASLLDRFVSAAKLAAGAR